jgi:RNA polymerase sigma factor (sigma-70 family)
LASNTSSSVTKHIHTLFRTGTAVGLTDGSLLDRFWFGPADEAEGAFAALVERHGPMVLQVCRRILGHRHDAEDAAQAVFLVLARQARSIRQADSVASWLFGVATRVAARARLDAARRRLRERRGAEVAMVTRDVNHGDRDSAETWPELYQELGRLPERFRLPILLCHLEGLTYEQAAERLGCPVRTIQSRLVRARERLRDRLARRGVAPASPALTATLTPDAASAAVSESWKHATVIAAVRYAASGTAAAMIPSTVVVLARGAIRAMNLHRLTKWSAALLLIGVAVGGAGMEMLARSASPQPEGGPTAEPEQNRCRVKMGGGVTFEVVAISSFPSGRKTWWRPDGTPLDDPPADPLPYPYHVPSGEELRTVLVQINDLPKDAYLRWLPTFDGGSSGHSPTRGGKKVPGLEAYIVSLRRDRATCEVKVRLAAGPWKTEVSNDGAGGTGMFVNGHKFAFGKARAYEAHGRRMTVFAVAHNFFDQDRRLVAIDRNGIGHPAVSYSAGSDGDKKWVIDIIDAEFPLPPDQIKDYQVQFRPFELAEIKDIALNPMAIGKPATKTEGPPPETRPTTALSAFEPNQSLD